MIIRRKDNSDAKKKILDQLGKSEIRVGFFENAKYPDGTPIAYVAAIQEFGHGPIPPRPSLRPAQEQNKGKWLKGIVDGVNATLDGKVTIDYALEQVGQVAAGDVRKAIKAVTAPPLKASTLAARQRRKKGKKSASAKPLVDTGQMIQAVTSAVVKK